MRKSFLRKMFVVFAAVLLCADVMAQSVTEKKSIGDDAFLYGIDASFTYDQTYYLIDFVGESAIVYNDELEIVKSIDANILGGLQVSSMIFGGSTSMFETASVTQTLFNNDEKFEYICGGDIGYDEDGFPSYYKGLRVINEDGESLYEFQGKVSRYDGVTIIQINGKNYLRIVETHENWEYTTHFMRIDKGTNNIQEVRRIKGCMNIVPAIANRDEQITITLNDDNNSAARELIITGVNGQLVERRTIPAGENSVKVSAAMMRSGMYNFTLQKKGEVVDNGKVIVK